MILHKETVQSQCHRVQWAQNHPLPGSTFRSWPLYNHVHLLSRILNKVVKEGKKRKNRGPKESSDFS